MTSSTATTSPRKRALADRLRDGPKWYADGPQIGNFKQAAVDPDHPDHRLARMLAGAEMAKLPLTDRATLLGLLTTGVPNLDRPATAADAEAIAAQLFGAPPALQQGCNVAVTGRETIHDVYAKMIESDAFRAACGRIAASYSW